MAEAKNILHVGNVVLTDDCLSALKSLQEDSNDCINELVTSLMTAIVMLTIPQDDLGMKFENRKKTTVLHISETIEYLENLKTS